MGILRQILSQILIFILYLNSLSSQVSIITIKIVLTSMHDMLAWSTDALLTNLHVVCVKMKIKLKIE